MDNINAFDLNKLGINELNSLQQTAIKGSEENDSVVIYANTGSGKTIAFLIPALQQINPELKHIQVLILAPSRELVLQIEDVARKLFSGFKILACYGGHKREIEENSLVETPALLIATTGRLCDHIRRNNVDLSNTNFLVIDEFDKMLELGFEEEMKFILEKIPGLARKILTSATRQKTLPEYLNITEPLVIDVVNEADLGQDILRVHKIFSSDIDKLDTLKGFLCYARDTTSIVFANHRESVERIYEYLHEQGIYSVFYHGGMEQRDREVALTKFKNTSSNILITTDLASRGLDISNVRNIVHYHLPLDEASFTHRNGRTARMGNTGNVYVLYNEKEKLPAFIDDKADSFEFDSNCELPERSKWTTLFVDAGKKNKISKADILGLLIQKGGLKKDEVGMIDSKDYISFVAIRKSKASDTINNIKDEKLKGKKIKIAVAK